MLLGATALWTVPAQVVARVDGVVAVDNELAVVPGDAPAASPSDANLAR